MVRGSWRITVQNHGGYSVLCSEEIQSMIELLSSIPMVLKKVCLHTTGFLYRFYSAQLAPVSKGMCANISFRSKKKKVPRSKKTCIPHSSMWKFIHLQLVRTSLGRCVLDVVQRHVSSDLFNVLHLGRTSVATPREPRQGPPSPGRCPSKVPESHRAWNATGCGEGASRELMSLNGDFMRS
jgi:hypothetical protein